MKQGAISNLHPATPFPATALEVAYEALERTDNQIHHCVVQEHNYRETTHLEQPMWNTELDFRVPAPDLQQIDANRESNGPDRRELDAGIERNLVGEVSTSDRLCCAGVRRGCCVS